MKTYLKLMEKVRSKGLPKGDRTGTGTSTLFGEKWSHDLATGFPILTTKFVAFNGALEELLWFLRAEDTTTSMKDKGVDFWDPWTEDKRREPNWVGRYVGVQWRRWAAKRDRHGFLNQNVRVDQIADQIGTIAKDPDSRRALVTAWNPSDLGYVALPPCHFAHQFQVLNGRLNCGVHMRSCDVFIGMPFDIVTYALLTHMVSKIVGLDPGRLVFHIGDCHLYDNHQEQVEEQLGRKPLQLPQLRISVPEADMGMGGLWIDDYRTEHFELENYNFAPAIKAPVAV